MWYLSQTSRSIHSLFLSSLDHNYNSILSLAWPPMIKCLFYVTAPLFLSLFWNSTNLLVLVLVLRLLLSNESLEWRIFYWISLIVIKFNYDYPPRWVCHLVICCFVFDAHFFLSFFYYLMFIFYDLFLVHSGDNLYFWIIYWIQQLL